MKRVILTITAALAITLSCTAFSLAAPPLHLGERAVLTLPASRSSASNPNSTITVINSNASGPGSLAFAIEAANSVAGPDVIVFASSVTSPIKPNSTLALTDVTGGTTIDGCSAPHGNPSIVVDFSDVFGPSEEGGIIITSDGNEICGLVIINSAHNGIRIDHANFNQIDGNFIGFDADGETYIGNTGRGILIEGSEGIEANGNSIGSALGNLISGSGRQIPWSPNVECRFVTNTLIANNYIGTDISGTKACTYNGTGSNATTGIALINSADVIIQNNLIASHFDNIWVYPNNTNITIQGNYIGTDITGNSSIIPRPPGMLVYSGGEVGIRCGPQSLNVAIGGDQAAEANVISAHGKGIELQGRHEGDPDFSGGICGNFIGVGVDGITPIPNVIGIEIGTCFGAPCAFPYTCDAVIGSSEFDCPGNVIAHNEEYGIHASEVSGGFGGLSIYDNKLHDNGLVSVEPMAGAILVDENSEWIRIAGNEIINNHRGVLIKGARTTDITVIGNVVYGNSEGPDIDLWPFGITSSAGWDADSPNGQLNFPIYYLYENGGQICASGVAAGTGQIKFYMVKDADQSLDGTFIDAEGVSHGGAVALLDSVETDVTGIFDFCGLDVDQGDVVTAQYGEAGLGFNWEPLTGGPPKGTSEFARNFHLEQLSFGGFSPVYLEVEDPNGNIVTIDGVNEIPGAVYDSLTDANDDGDPDDRIILPGAVEGDYIVRVFASPEAEPEDTYTLLTVAGDDTTVVANNVPVPDGEQSDDYQYDVPIPCCNGISGNSNDDPDDKVNISDVTFLVNYLFGIPSGPQPVCGEEGNVNGDPGKSINISDVTFLVAYLFGIPAGPSPPDCL